MNNLQGKLRIDKAKVKTRTTTLATANAAICLKILNDEIMKIGAYLPKVLALSWRRIMKRHMGLSAHVCLSSPDNVTFESELLCGARREIACDRKHSW